MKRRDSGMALLTVLVLALVAAGSSVSLIWLMNRQQRHAGTHYRSVAALWLAEAGVHKALSLLESVGPEHPRIRPGRPGVHTEVLGLGPVTGRSHISLEDGEDGTIIVVSAGETAKVTRRIRARVHLASPALLAALYATGSIRVDRPPAAMFLFPYAHPAAARDGPWAHIAVGQELWMTSTDVAINDPTASFALTAGPIDQPGTSVPMRLTRPGLIRLMLADNADLRVHLRREPVDVERLRPLGIPTDGIVLRTETFPAAPEPDEAFFRARAASNTANAELNRAAGKFVGDADLERKRDSLYSAEQFRLLTAYLTSGLLPPPRLQGIVYVGGTLSLASGQDLRVAEGALVVESAVNLNRGASLEITHSAATRSLPGLLVLADGGLILSRGARLRAHGLVYSRGVVSIDEGALLDVVGSVLSDDRGTGFQRFAGTVVIRYDSAVLGTPGLRIAGTGRVIAWMSTWEELPTLPGR